MMIKKVFIRDGEKFQAPSDRTRFAKSVQNVFIAAFTVLRDRGPANEAEVAPRTIQRTVDANQVPSMTSSASTTAAVAVAHGHADAHEYEEVDAYEERAPVPTATTNANGQMKAKKIALCKRASTSRGRSAAPAAPPEARATPAQGHPFEETSQRAARKPSAKKAKRSVIVKANKMSSSRLIRQLSSAVVSTHGANP
ncbi:hypothetical protein PF010_g4088 [Phytophthora fragariae]|uniref:Uncharacterized protein n=1 Tax=Phytophthora fragariae TaxID=53985 RepID=A0A6G0LSW6_9STRA|nr:hypothetical protein PF010_g4088 [Phytophthora fragariae]